ncbi:hypothetical protein [Shewanella inventionis]|uniref:Oligosaccharide repeat unit polymerase n=1 Tax=Shewanella inventionis TaxID=1738770 RepID=A0ABQ1J5T9_9GAMM|nr:hypothetical protein [Shewanella inventionis]MCL1159247.1 hypothetical protein [Shewanella inventionis]GGB60521.1 hypothetical protein GCM10011607_21510 [Shewanella inventionis]
MGFGAHPLGLFIFLQICLFSLPGVLLISFFNFESWRYNNINQDLKFEAGLWYFYSIIVIFYILSIMVLVTKLKSFNDLKYQFLVSESDFAKLSNVLILVSFLYVLFLFVLNDSLPIAVLFRDGLVSGYLARVEYQNNMESFRIPYVSDLMDQVVQYQFLFIIVGAKLLNIKISKSKLFFSFLLVFLLLAIDLQKSPIIIYSLLVIYVFHSFSGNFRKLFLLSLMIIPFVVLIYLVTTEIPIDYILTSISDRLFLGQNQGFYHILNSISPMDKYMWQGFPFSSFFNLEQYRADIDILPKIYDKSEYMSMVNANSFFLGQAWSMYGYLGLLISPWIVGFLISLYVKFFDFLISKNIYLFLPMSFLLIPTLKINQSFTYFLFPKHIIFNFLFLSTFIILLCFIFKFKVVKFENINFKR